LLPGTDKGYPYRPASAVILLDQDQLLQEFRRAFGRAKGTVRLQNGQAEIRFVQKNYFDGCVRMKQNRTFSFGKNWKRFLTSLDEDRVRLAEESLAEFLNQSDLRGRSFLDVGCGSGLFSQAALNLGADRIVSFDADPFSVECCKYMRTRANSPEHWEIHEGSVLDRTFLGSLGTFDIVYAWGVLHHTGKMWEAIGNSAELVAAEGLYYIALYNKIVARDGGPSWIHPFWLTVKRTYNGHPAVGKYLLEPLALGAYLGMVLARLENPVTHIRNYRSNRGMSWRTDATDWLGGYPFEVAAPEAVSRFFRNRGLVLDRVKTAGGQLGCNEFVFRNRKRVA
jgi:2-polyprenyl-6-hydroxyphenyl methylase/3-demethylubiquinone-9 3-methyltransferase